MTPDMSHAGNEAQIRKLIDEWVTALRVKNIDGLCPTTRRTSCSSTSLRRYNIAERMRIGRIGSSGFPRSRVRSVTRFAS